MTEKEKLVELILKMDITDTAGNIADFLIANGVTFHKWVPVALGFLPDEDGVYLVRTKTGSVTTARFYTAKTFPATHYRATEYHREATWSNNRHVTHWMPLPEPPKEVE